MDTVSLVLVLLVLTALAGLTARVGPALPLPLVQVAFGALAAWPERGVHAALAPEVFLLLFVPPLLFTDAWRIPQRELLRLTVPILRNALGLVFFTVLSVGFFVHGLIPEVPLPVAFALAAVLSPTDAVAVAALVGRTRVPARFMHMLEGEALINDASGLVAFRFALAAALTGTFSWADAARSFVLIVSGGFMVGFALAWSFSWARDRLVAWRGDEPAAAIVLSVLLLPFAAYLLAERLGCSGILASVGAGMAVSLTDLRRSHHVVTRLQTDGAWALLGFAFNGAVFVLLGLQLPGILGGALGQAVQQAGTAGAWRLLGEAAAVFGALLALRFGWIFATVGLEVWLQSLGGARRVMPALRSLAASTLAGVRGAITLAGVLALPLALPDGSPFPARDRAVFLAAAVILLSLLAASFGLPLLLQGLAPRSRPPHAREERHARARAAEAAIEEIERAQGEILAPLDAALGLEIGARLLGLYRRRVGAHDDAAPGDERTHALERQLHLAALRAERAELYRLRAADRINDASLRRLVREVDLVEAALTGRGF
jgi:Na+/H+ antiporter